MKKIEQNDVVSIEYELTKAGDSEVIDSNIGKEPLVFMVGKRQIIPGLEEQIIGMSQDDKADILVKAEKAYGEYNSEAIQVTPREQFSNIELQEGMSLYGQSEDGQTVMVTVKSFDDAEVTIDYNHPLAGSDLMFNVNILNVREPSANESATGQIAQDDSSGCGCGTGCGCH